jgi:hypothetical protein
LRETANPRDLNVDLLRNHHKKVHGYTSNDFPKEISSIPSSNPRMKIHQKFHPRLRAHHLRGEGDQR